jgi:hypothetical protein
VTALKRRKNSFEKQLLYGLWILPTVIYHTFSFVIWLVLSCNLKTFQLMRWTANDQWRVRAYDKVMPKAKTRDGLCEKAGNLLGFHAQPAASSLSMQRERYYACSQLVIIDPLVDPSHYREEGETSCCPFSVNRVYLWDFRYWLWLWKLASKPSHKWVFLGRWWVNGLQNAVLLRIFS